MKGKKETKTFTYEHTEDTRRSLRGRSGGRSRTRSRTSTRSSARSKSYQRGGRYSNTYGGKPMGVSSRSMTARYPSGYKTTSYGSRSTSRFYFYFYILSSRQHGNYHRKDPYEKTDFDKNQNVTVWFTECVYPNGRRLIETNNTLAFQMETLDILEEDNTVLIIVGIVMLSIFVLGCICYACVGIIRQINKPKCKVQHGRYSQQELYA